MRRGYRDQKSLNENLAPLRRFLGSQVGRPWNKVYADLSAGIDRRNTVQDHIYAHIENYVEIRTYWDASDLAQPNNGQCVRILGRAWRSGNVDLAHCYSELYVHPLSGLLLRNRYYQSYQSAGRERRQNQHVKLSAQRVRVSVDCECRRIDEIWYKIDFAPYPVLPKGETRLIWVVIIRSLVAGASPDRYACRKRQMSGRDIDQMKKGPFGPFSLGTGP